MWLEGVSKRQTRREKIRKTTSDHIMLGLVGHRKDFAFSLNGIGAHWSVLSKRMTQLDIF